MSGRLLEMALLQVLWLVLQGLSQKAEKGTGEIETGRGGRIVGRICASAK